MALQTTTTTAAITDRQLVIPVPPGSTVGMAINQAMQIDGEMMYISGPITNTSVKVRWRGTEGTPAVAHDVLAPVITGNPADFPAIAAGQTSVQPNTDDAVVTLGQDQTIVLPSENIVYYINKGSICNLTLAAPTAAQIGVQATIICNTAFAHVITYAAGFLGGANTVLTFTAKVGAAAILQVGIAGQVSVVATADQVTLSS